MIKLKYYRKNYKKCLLPSQPSYIVKFILSESIALVSLDNSGNVLMDVCMSGEGLELYYEEIDLKDMPEMIFGIVSDPLFEIEVRQRLGKYL